MSLNIVNSSLALALSRPGQVEDLFLTFAKKASAFNSWFENAEEDLTDPVRCNSLEEIRALREAHEAFRSSLSSAQADFGQLAELDRQIKSYQVVSNPYTWFTMEALEETWRNLQKIIKVRFSGRYARALTHVHTHTRIHAYAH